MLDALPGAIIAATIAPLLVQGGVSALAAVTAALLAMVALRNDFAAVAAGLVAAALVVQPAFECYAARMPLQSRVSAFGELFATPARGTSMGNRGGRLHDDEKNSANGAGHRSSGSAASSNSTTAIALCGATVIPSCFFSMR